MRTAHNDASLKSAFHSARHEAEKASGRADLSEKLISIPSRGISRSSPIVTPRVHLVNAIVPFTAQPKGD